MILIWSTYLYSSQLSWNVTHLKQNCRRWYGSYQPISIDAFNQRFWNLSIERRGFSYLMHNVNNMPRLYFFTKWLQNTRLLTVSILVSLSLSLSLSRASLKSVQHLTICVCPGSYNKRLSFIGIIVITTRLDDWHYPKCAFEYWPKIQNMDWAIGFIINVLIIN